jgi:flagellar motility protein MotE (MotC chaperone)
MTALRNPLLGLVAAILLSVAVGLFMFWRAAVPLFAQALALRAKAAAGVKPKAEKGWDFWTIEIENLSNELKDERARLHKQSDLLGQREARIAAERKELEAMRAELDGLRRDLGERVVSIRADEAKNLRTLAQTYANLTPRAAVAIIREMDDITVVKILFLMKPDVVGPIFEEMSRTSGPDGTLARRAALLSEKLRIMNASKTAANS